MKYYEVAYVDENDESLQIVKDVLNDMFLENIEYTDLNHFDVNLDNDVFIFVFDYLRKELPFSIMDSLEQLEGKTVACFVSIPMEWDEAIQKTIEKQIEPFLPDSVNDLGCFICPTKYSKKYLERLNKAIKENPNNVNALSLLEKQENMQDRPNTTDLIKVKDFFRKICNLS